MRLTVGISAEGAAGEKELGQVKPGGSEKGTCPRGGTKGGGQERGRQTKLRHWPVAYGLPLEALALKLVASVVFPRTHNSPQQLSLAPFLSPRALPACAYSL